MGERVAELREVPAVLHFHRPADRPFLASEKENTTILFGGLTWKHERFIRAVLQGCGYRCETLPPSDMECYQLGREHCNTGQCNPSYFTVGSLLRHLKNLQAQGLSRQTIIDSYLFITAGSCGPCRFGMYESEFRLALQNAGFAGFRVLLFEQDHGLHATTGEPGLKFTVDFGMGGLNAVILGDVVNDIAYRLRPYELQPGKTNEVVERVVERISSFLKDTPRFELAERLGGMLREIADYRSAKYYKVANTIGKVHDHLRGPAYRRVLRECSEELQHVELDRFRVKPVVKIIGEFWAQLTEGAGNYNLFAFLEHEGAELLVDPISTWVMYLLYQAKQRLAVQSRLERMHNDRRRLLSELHFDWQLHRKLLLFSLGENIYRAHYRAALRALGHVATDLVSQEELARLAHPHYNQMARGGEGHLEVGKSLYYTRSGLCHLVLAIKPFGCLPSTQSDAVQWALINQCKNMSFLSIETSGEGEIDALSRVQLALADARAKAREEFERCVETTGFPLDSIKDYAASHPEFRNALYSFPKHPGVAGMAANFVLHVSEVMRRRPLPIIRSTA